MVQLCTFRFLLMLAVAMLGNAGGWPSPPLACSGAVPGGWRSCPASKAPSQPVKKRACYVQLAAQDGSSLGSNGSSSVSSPAGVYEVRGTRGKHSASPFAQHM